MISKKVIIKVAAIISKSCMQYRNISISYSKVRRNTWVIETWSNMFLKVCNVDRFFKSSSREIQSLTEEGIHDFCEILVLLKGTDIFLLFLKG